MRYTMLLAVMWGLLAPASQAFADQPPLDCGKKSLASAIADATAKDPIITFTGVCVGPIVIQMDGLVLQGVGPAVIDGGGQDAITVLGASRVSLTDIEIRNGRNGLLALNGSHLSLTDLNVHGNSVFGVSLQTGSGAALNGVSIAQNGFHGLDLQTGSAVTVTGTLTSSDNGVFGINVNASSMTLSHATVSATGNALGIQIATGASAFINDSSSVINANNNFSTGLTVVSGAHLVSFGGTITASSNPVAGVSVNSKAGLDLDAASTLNSFNNGDGLLVQEGSVMTVFNTPQFSGAPGFSTVNTHDNTGNGVRILHDSTLTLVNQARITSTQNSRVGLIVDNGSSIVLVNSTLTGNTVKDLQLAFGTRADLQTLTFGTYTCDATVLVRGTAGLVCPH